MRNREEERMEGVIVAELRCLRQVGPSSPQPSLPAGGSAVGVRGRPEGVSPAYPRRLLVLVVWLALRRLLLLLLLDLGLALGRLLGLRLRLRLTPLRTSGLRSGGRFSRASGRSGLALDDGRRLWLGLGHRLALHLWHRPLGCVLICLNFIERWFC
jgi:hypothetical protein